MKKPLSNQFKEKKRMLKYIGLNPMSYYKREKHKLSLFNQISDILDFCLYLC